MIVLRFIADALRAVESGRLALRPERNADKFSAIMRHRKRSAMGRTMSSLGAIALLITSGVAASPAVAAKKAKPQPCPDQTYDLDGDVLGRSGVTLGVQGRSIVLTGVCDTRRGKVKATKKATQLQATWPRCGEDRKVRLQAVIDATCQAVNVTLRARGKRASKITGVRRVPTTTTTTVPTSTLPTTTAPSSTITTTTRPSTTTTTLPVSCTEAVIRQAIESGGDVELPCSGFTIPVTQPFQVAAGKAVRLTPAGAQPMIFDGGGATRFFVVAGTLSLENLVVQRFAATGVAGTNGVAASDGDDGTDGTGGAGAPAGSALGGSAGQDVDGGAVAIMPGGMMRADGVVFRDNTVRGGDGGPAGVCNGPPTGQACGDGGAGGSGSAGADVPAGTGGAGGNGGVGGAAILASGGGPAGDGSGGAIYNAGELWIVDCSFEGNRAAGGVGAGGDLGGTGGLGGSGGRGGNGKNGGRGGNGGNGGSGGKGGRGGDGGSGYGAAIFNAPGGALSVSKTAFIANLTSGGAGGGGGDGGTCGEAGEGGDPGSATNPNSTDVGGDGGRGGNGGPGGNAGAGGDAIGGAIYGAGAESIEAGTVSFSGNQVVAGVPGKVGAGSSGCPAGNGGDQGNNGTPGGNGGAGSTASAGIARSPDVEDIPL